MVVHEFGDCLRQIYQGWEVQSHAHLNANQILNPSTSAKPFMVKLQNLFVALVNKDIFHTYKLRGPRFNPHVILSYFSLL